MAMLDIFGDDRIYINEDNFFPEKHWVKVRPSDCKALFNRVMKEGVLYGIFYDFLFNKTFDKHFIDKEIRYVVKNNTNLVALLNGTVGTGKSQLSRAIAKKLAYERGMNIRFIVDKKRYDKSGHKEGAMKVILNPAFKETMNCYITYRFHETSQLVGILKEKEMIIQDEVDKSMGTDSKLIKIKVDQVLAVAARKNMISVIFNTPLFIPIKNVNLVIETFGVKNNGDKVPLSRDNMITFGILYDKKCLPFSIGAFKVWETSTEHNFYEMESKIRKGEFKRTGGGSTVNPDEELVKQFVEILVKRAASEGITKRDSMKCLARYTPELVGVESGTLNDVVSFAWDKYSQYLSEGIDPGFDIHFKPKKKIGSPIKKTKKGIDDVRPKSDDSETISTDPAMEAFKEGCDAAVDKEKIVETPKKEDKEPDDFISVEKFTEILDSGEFALSGKSVIVDKDGNTNLKMKDISTELADTMKSMFGDRFTSGETVVTRNTLIEWYGKSVDATRKKREEEREREKHAPETPEPETRHREKVISGAFTREHITAKTVPLLNFVSNKVRDDYGVYEQKLWDLIVGAGMGYDGVAEKLEREGIKKSHATVGSDFMKVREGSAKDGKPIGYGYYGELWWANENNDSTYTYLPPGNESAPDYIHKDGTIDSVKTYYAFRAIYLNPFKDCKPEYTYCVEHKIKFFRVVIFNLKVSSTDVVIKMIDVDDAKRNFKINPNHFKAC